MITGGTTNAFTAGLNGLQRGIRQANTAAQEIASAELLSSSSGEALPEEVSGIDSLSSLSQSMVDLILAENQVAASAAVVRASDRMVGYLIDTSV